MYDEIFNWIFLGLSLIFPFSTNDTILQETKVEAFPYIPSIQCQDLNSQPLNYDPPLTTRPGLQPWDLQVSDSRYSSEGSILKTRVTTIHKLPSTNGILKPHLPETMVQICQA